MSAYAIVDVNAIHAGLALKHSEPGRLLVTIQRTSGKMAILDLQLTVFWSVGFNDWCLSDTLNPK